MYFFGLAENIIQLCQDFDKFYNKYKPETEHGKNAASVLKEIRNKLNENVEPVLLLTESEMLRDKFSVMPALYISDSSANKVYSHSQI